MMIAMKVERRPMKSPWMTKKVRSSLRPTVPFRVSGCHQEVQETTSPDGSMMAEMPVLALRAIQRRVSMARRREYDRCWT